MARHEFRLQRCKTEGWTCVGYPTWWDETTGGNGSGILHDQTREAIQFLYNRETPGWISASMEGIFISDPNVAFEFRMRFT